MSRKLDILDHRKEGGIRRKALQVVMAVARTLVTPWACVFAPRRRSALVLLFLSLFCTAGVFFLFRSRLPREDLMEQKLAELQIQLEYLHSQHRATKEVLIVMERRVTRGNISSVQYSSMTNHSPTASSFASESIALLEKNLTGTKAGAGLNQTNLKPLNWPSTYQLLPHLMDDSYSIRPAYHMSSSRDSVDFVIGIPTVKRDKESYLMTTLKHLVDGMSDEEANCTLIIILVGETDLEYVVGVAKNIETEFQNEVENGLIEVISTSPSYYPNLETISTNLGDSLKRTMWRTKHNLDTIFLMSYGQSKGTYYLMLEDDIVSKQGFMKKMKVFITEISVKNPDWVWIEFCPTGGIGKLFKSSLIPHFITYVQLFYNSKPIDWLIETYLVDRVCGINTHIAQCHDDVLEIRPKHKESLFEHIGLYSSLKGKIMKTKNQEVKPSQLFFPHRNPPVDYIISNINAYSGHTIQDAYDGKAFFWGLVPKQGSYIEFWFAHPVFIGGYIIRSGNPKKPLDRFYNSVVEVLALNTNGSYVHVGDFDEFGLAEGKIPEELGSLFMIRIRVLADSKYWVIISEISLKSLNDTR